MLQIKKIKPIGCQVLITEELYGYDDENAAGIVEAGHFKGDLKTYQWVVAIGDDVKWVKPGDRVEINLARYAVFKEDPNSVKAMADNPIVGFRLNEVEMVDATGDPITCMLIDQRDIKYILEDAEEVKYAKDDTLIKIESPTPKLILPAHRIRV
jgi:hypothetical protein